MISAIIIILLSSLIDMNIGQHMSSSSSSSHYHHHLNYRRQMNMMRTLAQKAYEHGIRINEEAQCSKPRAELIYLNDSKKIYLPRATLLYRCSDLTGCCPHATHSCEPSRVEKVTLYFFVIGVPQSSSSTMMIRRNQNIEQLTFINHTECACKPIDTMWSLEKLNTAVDVTMNGQNDSIQQQQQQQQIRNIREQSTAVIHARNSGNDNHHHHHQHHSMYQETENVLKYWAKIMGYNADNNKKSTYHHHHNNNNPHYHHHHHQYEYSKKRNNKRNTTKKIMPSSGRSSNYSPNNNNRISPTLASTKVTFKTPDVQYTYSTIHESSSSSSLKNRIADSTSSSSSFYDQQQQNPMDNNLINAIITQTIPSIDVSASDHDHVTYYIASNNQQQQQQQLNNVHNNDKIIYTLDDYY
nr:G-box-binding factor-like [Dermatophagoides farinae]